MSRSAGSPRAILRAVFPVAISVCNIDNSDGLTKGANMRWRTSIDFGPPELAPPNQVQARATRALLMGVLVLSLAAAVLWSVLALGGVTSAKALTSAGTVQPLIDATHLPPLLTVAGDHLSLLRYDITCTEPATESGSNCDVGGTVYARAGATGAFHALPLHLDAAASVDRYTATLPTDIAASATGFSYYAVIRDRLSGATVTLPAGGASAPQQSLRLANPINIHLGTHQFGNAQAASARVASAPWGNGPGDVGIEDGPQLDPIGAASFDVDTAGTVTVLDEAHKRLLRFANGTPSAPTAISVGVRGTIADLAVRPDGGSYVLESVADPGQTPLLRSFDNAGQLAGTWRAAEPTASALRLGSSGPQALEYPASQWMPIATTPSDPGPAVQRAQGTAGRALVGGQQLIAQREGTEARIALVGPAGVVKSWRIRTATPLAEIQLAEPIGQRVVVVLRTYTDTDSEFATLVLGDHGLDQHFSVDASEWAESAPLSRFRLVGSSLFHLGSTATGMFVDRFDLEVH